MTRPRFHRPIGLGDLLRATAALDASDHEAAAIAAMLGLRPDQTTQPRADGRVPAAIAAPVAAPAVAAVPHAAVSDPVRQPFAALAAEAQSARGTQDGESELSFIGSKAPPAQSWISNAAELEPPMPTGAVVYDETVPAFEPLLVPGITRAILAEAASTWESDGSIDVDRLVHDVATQRPVRELPRLPATTLRRGAQILVDRTVSMQPFQVDTDDLAARIQQVTSQGATQLLFFDEDPSIVDDTWPVTEGRPHELPSAGTPILIITDLGVRDLRATRSRARNHWLMFGIEALRRRCPVIAFVPYPAPRWPTGLSGLMTVVPWDRKTTVATVRAARRAGSR